MIPYILLGICVVVAVLLVVIAIQPSEFKLSRSATVNSPPSEVFAHVVDLKKWQAWSPWEGLDPDLKRTYDGPDAGAGASYHWTGNDKVGEGRMTITDARPPERIAIKLEFVRPFAATNLTEFTFVPAGPGTTVTWTMSGRRNFMMKAFSLVMTRMLTKQFDQGLASLKRVAETRNA